jgi:hypothetical protein
VSTSSVSGKTKTDSSALGSSTRSSSLYRRPNVVAATANYGMICFAYVILDETLPLFLKLDADKGGFAYNSHDIGVILSISGFLMLVFTVTILPLVANGDKPRLFIYGTWGTIPAAMLYPFGAAATVAIGALLGWHSQTSSVQDLPMLSYVFLITVKTVQSIFACLAFTAIVVQVNESVAENELADVNAMGQMFAALSRAVGPGIGGVLWTMSVKSDFIYGNFIGVVVVLFLASLLNQLVVAKIPKTLSNKDFKRRAGKSNLKTSDV